MRRRRGWNFYDYEPSRPRPVHGGIKAHSQRGAFGRNWWAERWIAGLERLDIGARLARGRSYARQGQVLDIRFQSGAVTARVQGSRARPYRVTIRMRPLSQSDWRRLAAVLAGQVGVTARLLAGEMPPEIEQALTAADLSLFPQRHADLETECSCPDWSNPCKHIAAVYYLLAEEFDRDPFLLFQLRGLSRDEFLGLLAEARPVSEQPPPGDADRRSGGHGEERVVTKPDPATTAPLPADPALFWQGPGLPVDERSGETASPSLTAALPRQLGNFPFWRGAKPWLPSMAPVYVAASRRGVAVLLAASAGSDRGGDSNG